MKNIKLFKRGIQKDHKKVHRLGMAVGSAALVMAILPMSGCATNHDLDVTYYENTGAWFIPFSSLEAKYADINTDYVNIKHFPIEKLNELLGQDEVIINDNEATLYFDKEEMNTAVNVAEDHYETRKNLGIISQVVCTIIYTGIVVKLTKFGINQHKSKQKIKEKLGI